MFVSVVFSPLPSSAPRVLNEEPGGAKVVQTLLPSLDPRPMEQIGLWSLSFNARVQLAPKKHEYGHEQREQDNDIELIPHLCQLSSPSLFLMDNFRAGQLAAHSKHAPHLN